MSDDSADPGLFFPYYVNQPRLIDLFALFNNGLSEFEELKEDKIENSKVSGKGGAKIESGFKCFKVGATLEAGAGDEKQSGESVTTRRVQTVTSMLHVVLGKLGERGYVRDIAHSKEGDFVIVPVRLKINSMKSFMDEVLELGALVGKMNAVVPSAQQKKSADDFKKVKDIANLAGNLFESEEIISEDNSHAVMGNISDSFLYQARKADLVDVPLVCLGQVHRIYPEGTQLMKNTIFAKFKDVNAKQRLIDALVKCSADNQYDFSSSLMFEISDKPVYQLEIVALYQVAEPALSENLNE